ncbi:extracellular solute-binding protein [Paenibacillus sp. S3N08]|uniref:Extracellular solute-binding protein n=2 Tax=Paenibacillus agricola TaxID=2716264 RepID=A0ABX0J2A4_9BACL|nr:extracellular solute-binding protein [Paenibacillus agricola]
MKRTMKLSLITAAALTLIITGCSSTTTEPGATPAPAPAKTDTKVDKVKLTMGSWRTEDKEAYEKIIKEFQSKNPNIEIEFKPTKNTEYNTLLNTSLQTGSAPDIIHLRPYAPGIALADGGYLEPLDTVKGLDVISKEALTAATGKDGKVYGVPTVFSSTQIFYNKKLFKQFSIEEPKTWADLIKAADTLKQNKITPFAFGSKEGWLISLTHGALAPAIYGGTDFVTKVTTGQTNLKSKEFGDSVQMMQDLSKYFPDNYIGLSMDDMRNLFVTEQAAMMVMGDWEVAVMKKMNPDLDMDLFPVPNAAGKATVTTWVDGSFGVNKESKGKKEALKFIEFMTTKEFGTLVANELKKPSTIPGVISTDPIVTKISNMANSISTPYLFVIHFNGGNPTSKSVFEQLLQGMYLNKETPAQVTEELQKSVDSWFKPIAK